MTGVFANLYSQVITILIQVASLPIFLSRWNAVEYGHWILISAVPAYLTLADAGVLTASTNMMSMHGGRGDISKVNAVFRCSLLFIVVIVPSITVLCGTLLWTFSFGLTPDQRAALFLLIAASMLIVASGLLDLAYRPFGKYARATFLSSNARIAEWVGSIVGLFYSGTLVGAAFGLFFGRLLYMLMAFHLCRLNVPQIKWTIRDVDIVLLWRIVRSGAGFLVYSLGSLVSLQGMIILIGIQFGGTQVASFNSSRTLSRLLAQLSIISAKSMSPEISLLHGADRHEEVTLLRKRVMYVVLPTTLVGAIVLSGIGPFIFSIWTRGKIPFDRTIFNFLLLSAIATAYWQLKSIHLTSTNRHWKLSILYFAAAFIGLCVAAYFGASIGVLAAVMTTFLIEITMAVGATVLARQR